MISGVLRPRSWDRYPVDMGCTASATLAIKWQRANGRQRGQRLMGDRPSDCEFCQEFRGAPYPIRDSLAKNGIADRRIAQGQRSIAFVGLGPLSVGYALICPIDHKRCLADLDVETLREIDAICSQVIFALIELEGAASCFEHGSRFGGRGGACYDHAHLHAIGGGADLRAAARELGREIEIDGLAALPKACEGLEEYLLIHTGDRKTFLYEVSAIVPSQFFRQRWAWALGADSYDWGVSPNYSLMRDSLDFYRRSFMRRSPDGEAPERWA